VRPAISHAKLGLSILRTQTERRDFIQKNPVDTRELLVEELISGQEVTTIGLVEDGNYLPGILCDKFVSQQQPLFAEMKHRFPSHCPAETQNSINKTIQNIVDLCGLKSGPLVAEFLVNKNGQIYLVEIAPEVGGEFLVESLLTDDYGVNYFRSLARIATGQPANFCTTSSQLRSTALIIRYLMPTDGQLKKVFFPETLLTHPGLKMARQLRSDNSKLSTRRGNLDRPAVFSLQGNYAELENLERTAEQLAGETTIEYFKSTNSLESSLPA